MGDYTNVEITVKGANAAVRERVRGLFEDYAPTFTYTDEEDDTSLDLGGNEIRVGAAEEILENLQRMVAEGFEAECNKCNGEGAGVNGSVTIPCPACNGVGERMYHVDDFAWWIEEEAKYEYPQIDHVHVPGVGDWSSSAGGESGAAVLAVDLEVLVDAATDLDELKDAINLLTGRSVRAAFKAL